MKTYNRLLEAVFQHAEKWEASDIKETGASCVHIITTKYDTIYTDEDVTVSSELLLPHQVVSNIATQTCMLRHHGIIHQVCTYMCVTYVISSDNIC